MPGAPVYLGDEQGDANHNSQQQKPLLPQTNEKREEEKKEAPSAPRGNGPECVICMGITYLSSLAFMGLVIYALVVSDTESVTAACGRALWNFMCVRLGFAFFEFFVMCFVRRETLIGDQWGEGRVEGAAYALMLMGITHIVLLGTGSSYVSQAMNNETCRTAMASVSVTDSPLLGILEYTYVGLDGFVTLLIIYLMILALDACELIR